MDRKWPIIGCLSLAVAIVGVVVSILVLAYMHQTRQEDLELKRKDAQPFLDYAGGPVAYDDDGYTVLTLVNKSPVAPAAISFIHFAVSDPTTLDRIARKHPRPQGPVEMAQNIADNAVFTEGEWITNSSYGFSICVGYNIPPSSVNDIRLAIVNPKWAGQTFEGQLSVEYNGENSPFQLWPVPVKVRRRP